MSSPVLPQTTPDNPCLLPAFLGWKHDRKHGTLFWTVCGWCPPDEKAQVEGEAARLGVRVSHGMCDRCYATELARITGDTL